MLQRLKNQPHHSRNGRSSALSKTFKSTFRTTLAAAAGLLGSVSLAQAENVEVDFSGFASIVAAQTISGSQGDLDNISTDLELSSFNRLGLRFDVDLYQKLSFTVQFLAEGARDYEPQLDWLYVSYAFSPELRLTAGKTRLPLFLYSNVLDVGYAYPWIAPPYSVYGVPSVHSNEGLEFNYVTDLGHHWTSDLTIWAGQSTEQLQELEYQDLEIREAVGFAWAVEHDWLTLRAVYYTGITTTDLNNVQDAANLLGALEAGLADLENIPGIDLSELREDIFWEDKRAHFVGLGTIMDFDQFFVIAEATSIDVNETIAVGDLISAYATGGYRVSDDWTVHLTFAYDYDKANDDVYSAYAKATRAIAASPEVAELGRTIEQAVEGYQSQINKTFTLGARWDFHPNAAFKTEYIYEHTADYDAPTRRPQALRAAIDLVF
ncbi:Uncharacterised protein [BD1-7 clade bacterium]|uniref:Porin domain-containing protein n=1 Tax=BD1-7 clade bacterium TaxID=2029982 RepID=A0A5S9QFA3_9GAMM|nr:Uncharacterised protein [BD1-7 clade bacterium]